MLKRVSWHPKIFLRWQMASCMSLWMIWLLDISCLSSGGYKRRKGSGITPYLYVRWTASTADSRLWPNFCLAQLCQTRGRRLWYGRQRSESSSTFPLCRASTWTAWQTWGRLWQLLVSLWLALLWLGQPLAETLQPAYQSCSPPCQPQFSIRLSRCWRQCISLQLRTSHSPTSRTSRWTFSGVFCSQTTFYSFHMSLN